jgi:hypothetical protein
VAIYTSGIICEKALNEDGVLSAIRIVDHLTVALSKPVPDDAHTIILFPLKFAVILSFKSDQPEEFDAQFSGVRPDGKRVAQDPLHVNINELKGHFVRIEIGIDPRMIGLWRFEVTVRGETALKLPFSIRLADPEGPQEPQSQQST